MFKWDICRLVPRAKLHSEANRKLGQLLQSLPYIFQMLLSNSPCILELEETEMYQSFWALPGCLYSCCAFLVLILSSFSSPSSGHTGTHSVCRATSMGDRQCQHFTHRAKSLCRIKTCKLSMKPKFPLASTCIARQVLFKALFSLLSLPFGHFGSVWLLWGQSEGLVTACPLPCALAGPWLWSLCWRSWGICWCLRAWVHASSSCPPASSWCSHPELLGLGVRRGTTSERAAVVRGLLSLLCGLQCHHKAQNMGVCCIVNHSGWLLDTVFSGMLVELRCRWCSWKCQFPKVLFQQPKLSHCCTVKQN